uniref:Uncharacterized protein n=1 Tax=viral metagenome TaxID=1070528 RepID=A0A6C0IKG1_9ZZZZ
MTSSCNCSYNTAQPSYNVAQCVSCSSCQSDIVCSAEITQKRIWNQVRIPSSLYAMNVSALTSAAERLQNGPCINWNQRSDRQNPSIQTAIHPSHGNSLKSSLTSNRPGTCAPGGVGVDIKHDSYARYLNRKKAGNLKTQNTKIATKPIYGNKTYAINAVTTSIECNCKPNNIC